jgi:hypothetical protein
MFCLVAIGSMASSASVSETGIVIQQNSLNALPINIVGRANIDYNINIKSGGNVSVYLIDQDQLTNLENGVTFISYPALSCLDIGQASRSGNLTSGKYYLVMVNGLSVTSNGPVTVDYHLNVGGQTGQISLISWIWSAIALAATVAMAIGIVNMTRGKRTKPIVSKRSNTLK